MERRLEVYYEYVQCPLFYQTKIGTTRTKHRSYQIFERAENVSDVNESEKVVLSILTEHVTQSTIRGAI